MSEDKIEPMKNFVAGGFGGICLLAAGYPLDTIKVRLQTMNKSGSTKYKGTFDCGKQVFKKEGVRGFYKGMAFPLIGVAPLYAITYFGFTIGKQLQQERPYDPLSNTQLFIAGMVN